MRSLPTPVSSFDSGLGEGVVEAFSTWGAVDGRVADFDAVLPEVSCDSVWAPGSHSSEFRYAIDDLGWSFVGSVGFSEFVGEFLKASVLVAAPQL